MLHVSLYCPVLISPSVSTCVYSLMDICIYLLILMSNTNSISDDVCVLNSKTTGVTSGTGTAYPSGAHEFTSSFLMGLEFLNS